MRKQLALFLVLALLLGLCACAGEESSASVVESTSVAAVEEPISEAPQQPEVQPYEPDSEAAPAEESVVEAPVPEDDFLPLCEETEILRVWQASNPMAGAYLENGFDSHSMYQEVEALTNVDVEWISPNIFAAAENFQLMIASNDLPDLIYEFTANYNGGSAGIDDELIVDICEFVDAGLTPHFKAVLDSNDHYWQGVLEVDGRMASFPALCEDKTCIVGGLLVRQDWLDQLGLTAPETYDELHNVLVTMKSELNLSDGPLWLPADGIPNYNNLVQGFGTIAKNAMDGSIPIFMVDGDVKFGTVEAAFKEYISLMAQWYEEGLIYSDFVTVLDPHGVSSDLAATGKVGVFEGEQGFITSFAAIAEDPDYSVTPMADIVKKSGDVTHCLKTSDLVRGTGISITTQCVDPELAAKWCDFWYSSIGHDLINYGVEGYTYNRGEDGSIQWTEVMTNNPYGMTLESATALYCTFMHAGLMDPHRTFSVFNDVQLSCYDVWAARSDDDWKYPVDVVKLTTEETTLYNSVISDVLSYSNEMILKWITGAENVDTTWDTYLAQMDELGVQDVIDIYQTAYDRYAA